MEVTLFLCLVGRISKNIQHKSLAEVFSGVLGLEQGFSMELFGERIWLEQLVCHQDLNGFASYIQLEVLSVPTIS